MSRINAPRGRPFIAAYAALLLLAAAPVAVIAQSKPAVVEGTTQLFIRRGPGTEFPPFATLTGGSQVQVEEMHGSWARVTTASGQMGYVHTRYLKMAEAEPAQPPTVEPTVAQPTPRQPPPTSTKRRAATKTRRPVEREEETPEVLEPTATPLELPANTRPRNSAAVPASLGEQAEIKRLADAVEALNRRFDQRLPVPNGLGSTVIEPTTGVSGGAVLLGLLGVVVGWLLGATYQRNKERGRRSRIRL